jgi:transcriptional regulator with XRE-family HTH domain
MSNVGPLLREWRQRRRLSQLDLAVEAEVSSRHLSFVETGRSQPSRELVLHLAERLDVPLRERNALLLAAGYAPVYRETPLDAPDMAPVRDALDRILAAHAPFPAVVVDRGWSLVAANDPALGLLTSGVSPTLLEPPVNALRVSLHPDGLAPRIGNLAEWSAHLLDRLRRERDVSGDPALAALYDELRAYPRVVERVEHAGPALFVPLELDGLRFFSTVATFGTALDVTLAELSIESFFPADAATRERFG